jgi:small-conductance mechanosensitive channel/CRP-like cAMP-binding protein
MLAEELWSSWTPVLVLSYAATLALVKSAPRPIERYHMRGAGMFVVGHVIALAIGVGQTALGYEAGIAEICALAFKAFATVTLGVTAVFRALLPRVGVVLPRILIDLITGLGMIVAFIVIGRRAGFSVTGLITTSAVLTAVIAFSLQDTLGNVMGGLSVQLDKSIAVGDWVSLGPGQPTGQVVEIRWRYTAIQTQAWNTIIVPNGALVKSQVTILGRRAGSPRQSRRQVDFFVDFRTPPTEVLAAVERALQADPVPRMAREPAPDALFFGVRDSYAHYCVRYWLEDLAADDPTDSAVRVRIWYALRRADIPMSIPASSVFLTHETPERAERKAAEELSRRLAALASVDLFRGLPEATRRGLACDLVYTPFARGEAITREGAHDDGLFMLVSGEAIVRLGSGPEARDVARLVAGQFFGEMSLMTGEARTASVIAATDVVCYRVDKPAFERILRETPSVADSVAEILATRRMALEAARDERDEHRRHRMENVKQDLLGKIRGFFGLDRAGQ